MGVYTLGIVGESFRQKEIKFCHEGEGLILKREPKNKYDKNAVAVLRRNGNQIGYLSREDAEWMARIIDEGTDVAAKIKKITGGTRERPSYGVVIDVNTTPEVGWEEKRKGQEASKAGRGFWKRIFGG